MRLAPSRTSRCSRLPLFRFVLRFGRRGGGTKEIFVMNILCAVERFLHVVSIHRPKAFGTWDHFRSIASFENTHLSIGGGSFGRNVPSTCTLSQRRQLVPFPSSALLPTSISRSIRALVCGETSYFLFGFTPMQQMTRPYLCACLCARGVNAIFASWTKKIMV
jgi:hypothetical protein